jgi:DNA segregation ATPase FtsK/SpoIIIE-like protein
MNNETFDWNSRDHLFDEVVAYARGQKRLTASGISYELCIGFNRAKRIIKQLEQAYIIGDK